MPVANKTEGSILSDLIVEEFDGRYNRRNVIIASGAGVLKRGTVLGRVTASGKYLPSPATGSTGEQVGVAVLIDDVDATSADQVVQAGFGPALLVAEQGLIFAASVNDATKKAAKIAELATANIIAVKGV